MTKTNMDVDQGMTIHFLQDGLTYSLARTNPFVGGEISRRGQTLHLTAEDVEASRDQSGSSFWTLSDDEQLALWGKVFFRIGEFPESESLYIRGTMEHAEARERARMAAWALPDGPERAAAFERLTATFGAAPITSRTLSEVRSTEDAAAAWQKIHQAEATDADA